MANTKVSFIEILWILLLSNHVFGDDLPTGCHLKDLTVTCQGKNVTELPVNIPEFVTHLHIMNASLGILHESEGFEIGHLSKLTIENSDIANIVEFFFRGQNINKNEESQLSTVFLNGNGLHSLKDGLFQPLVNLKELSLADNYIDTMNGVFKGLSALQKLHLQDNNITLIDNMTFNDLVNLTYLDISRNTLTRIDGEVFANNRKLTELLLNGNNLNGKEVSLSTLNLTKLWMNDCQLEAIPHDIPASLTVLHLNKNKITIILKDDLKNLENLTELKLAENSIQSVPYGIFDDFKHLNVLDLSGNQLETIPGPFPSSIRHIKLDNNHIHTMATDHFHWMGPYMFHMELTNNFITEIKDNLFRNNIQVHSLQLSGNPITKLKRGTFSLAQHLYHLDLSNLQLSEIQEDAFIGLEKLSMFLMKSVQVPEDKVADDIFKHVNPHVLDLSESPALANNFLKGLTGNNRSVPGLKHLFLQDNNLTSFTSDLQPYLPAISMIRIAGNHFHCGKDLVWLEQWYLSKPYIFIDIDTAECSNNGEFPLDLLFQQKGLSLLHPEAVSTPPFIHPSHEDLYDIDMFNNTYYDYNFTDDTNDDYYLYYTESPHHPEPITYVPTTVEEQIQMDYTTVEPDMINMDTNTGSSQNVKTTVKSDIDNVTSTTVLTTNSLSTSTGSTPNRMKDPNVPIQKNNNSDNDDSSVSMKSVGIAIGMSFGVILAMLLIALIVFKIFLKPTTSPEMNGHTPVSLNYVSVQPKADKPEPKVHRKLSRAERGSTTSHASEDITNHIDMDMKVYTLDMGD